MRTNTFDPKSISKILLSSSQTILPDPKVFSIYSKKFQNEKNRSERIRKYWKSTGRYLQIAMNEIELQTPNYKEDEND